MRKIWIGFIICLMLSTPLHASDVSVFVSFSMPETLLEETLQESVRLHIPVYLNGLYHNSLQQTADKVMQLSKVIPHLNLQIDPLSFERFGIHQVPALVVENGNLFDVIYGHLTLKEALMRIAGRGDSGLTVASCNHKPQILQSKQSSVQQ